MLNEKIKLKPGNQITENVLNNTETIIKKHFVDKGFFNCKVDMVQKADTSPGNKVFLDIIVDKGKKVKFRILILLEIKLLQMPGCAKP